MTAPVSSSCIVRAACDGPRRRFVFGTEVQCVCLVSGTPVEAKLASHDGCREDNAPHACNTITVRSPWPFVISLQNMAQLCFPLFYPLAHRCEQLCYRRRPPLRGRQGWHVRVYSRRGCLLRRWLDLPEWNGRLHLRRLALHRLGGMRPQCNLERQNPNGVVSAWWDAGQIRADGSTTPVPNHTKMKHTATLAHRWRTRRTGVTSRGCTSFYKDVSACNEPISTILLVEMDPSKHWGVPKTRS